MIRLRLFAAAALPLAYRAIIASSQFIYKFFVWLTNFLLECTDFCGFLSKIFTFPAPVFRLNAQFFSLKCEKSESNRRRGKVARDASGAGRIVRPHMPFIFNLSFFHKKKDGRSRPFSPLFLSLRGKGAAVVVELAALQRAEIILAVVGVGGVDRIGLQRLLKAEAFPLVL